VRNALRPLLLATFLLTGCEDGKPVTPAPEEKPTPAAPAEPVPPPATLPSDAPRVHGATGVGDTAPAPERQPPTGASQPPSVSEWGQKSGADGGSAPDAGASRQRLGDGELGARPGQRGPPPGEAKGPARPGPTDAGS
jgi:hypothetical protein